MLRSFCRCWGQNNDGQLGNGYANTTTVVMSPPSTDLVTGVAQVVTGTFFTCVLLIANGSVQCFGEGAYGQLGTGSTANVLSCPSASVLSGATWIGSGPSSHHACAVLSNGSLYCWGYNVYGQVGNNDTSGANVLSPAPVVGLGSGVATVGGGQYDTCAVLSNGSVRCWGYANAGQVGNGIVVSVLAPPSSDLPGLNAVQVSAGQYHTCVILVSTGLRCWGGNNYGQVGQPSNVPWLTSPPSTDLIIGVTQVSCGQYHTCALMSATSGVRCFGINANGQLGMCLIAYFCSFCLCG